jgi:hypothetical protein
VEGYRGPVRDVISLDQQVRIPVYAVAALHGHHRILGRNDVSGTDRGPYRGAVLRRQAVDEDAPVEGMGKLGYPLVGQRLMKTESEKKHQGNQGSGLLHLFSLSRREVDEPPPRNQTYSGALIVSGSTP